MKRLGVLGTLVWDRIHRHADPPRGAEPLEEWGGIAYSLSALAAQRPAGWEIVPILKIGRDLQHEARRFLEAVPGLRLEPAVREVPEPTNRVELRYLDEARRCERLTGGVPPWTWEELAPLVRGLDALYVNFISGFEIGLRDAQQLREHYSGPIYADLHSLLLDRSPNGHRVLRTLETWREWLRCFDAIQVNEDELTTLASPWGDPWRFAAEAAGKETMLVLVTLGEGGAIYFAGADFPPDPVRWPEHRRNPGVPAPLGSARISLPGGRVSGDPTGCGDVWGSTLFMRLLGGDTLETAVDRAHRMAMRNVGFQGVSGLSAYLRGDTVLPRP